MPVADENLRNGAPIAARDHFLTKFGVLLDVDFTENHALLSQQRLGALTVGTPIRRVNRHGGLRHFELPLPPGDVFANGRLSFTQAFKPP